jgi:hypothetical protein
VKRILLVLTVALVVAMMVVMAAPAFAAGGGQAKGQTDANPGATANNLSGGESQNDIAGRGRGNSIARGDFKN